MEIVSGFRTLEQQYSDIAEVTDNASYEALIQDYFQEPKENLFLSTYAKEVLPLAHQLSSEYWRLLALTAVICKQFRFPGMKGQMERNNPDRHALSSFAVPHQVALLSYLGHINQQSIPIREQFVNRLEAIEETREIAWIGYGVLIFPQKGVVALEDPWDDSHLAFVAQTLIRGVRISGKFISIPDLELNQRLAKIQLEIQEADKLIIPNFNENPLNYAVNVMSPFLDLQAAWESYTLAGGFDVRRPRSS